MDKYLRVLILIESIWIVYLLCISPTTTNLIDINNEINQINQIYKISNESHLCQCYIPTSSTLISLNNNYMKYKTTQVNTIDPINKLHYKLYNNMSDFEKSKLFD